jgi:hypothetical protein
MSNKWINALLTAGLALGINGAFAQNTDTSQSQAQMDNGNFNASGERQIGLEQYQAEMRNCTGMAPEKRQDCSHMAKVRYEGWAIQQCQLVAGPNQQRCYKNIQANVMKQNVPGGTAAGTGTAQPQSGSQETGNVVRPGNDEDSPGRQ